MITLERATLPTEAEVADIRPSPLNPRKEFDPDALADLAASIGEHGILEPLVVRRDGDGYSIIAGERRFRAATLAGLSTVPIRVLEGIDDAKALQLMLVENLQRNDLNPVDEALAYRQLNTVAGLTQAEIAKAVHRSQPVIANAMRVLELPDDVVERIRRGELTRGHGVALARWKAFPALASKVAELAAANHATVKDLEGEFWGDWRFREPLDGLVQHLAEYDAGFDLAACLACPFGAYLPPGEGRYRALCLRPEHYRQLKAEAHKERQADVQRAVAATKAGGTDVLRVDRLAHGQYERLDPPYSKPPAGCSDACPCYAKALDRAGVRPESQGAGRLVPICTDPKRLAGLRAADTKAANADRKERKRLALERLEAQVYGLLARFDDPGFAQALGEMDKALAVIATAALAGARLDADTAKAILRRHKVTLPREVDGYRVGATQLQQLKDLPPLRLLAITLEAVLRRDLDEQYDGHGHGGRADWYLGADVAEIRAEQEGEEAR